MPGPAHLEPRHAALKEHARSFTGLSPRNDKHALAQKVLARQLMKQSPEKIIERAEKVSAKIKELEKSKIKKIGTKQKAEIITNLKYVLNSLLYLYDKKTGPIDTSGMTRDELQRIEQTRRTLDRVASATDIRAAPATSDEVTKGLIRLKNELIVYLKEESVSKIDAIIRDMDSIFREIKEGNARSDRGINGLSLRLESLEKYFTEDGFKKILQEIVDNATQSNNEKLARAIEEKFRPLLEGIRTDLNEQGRKIDDVLTKQEEHKRELDAKLESQKRREQDLLRRQEAREKQVREEHKKQSTQLKGLEEQGRQILEKIKDLDASDNAIIESITKLKDELKSDDQKNFIEEAVKAAFVAERPELLDKIIERFNREYPELKNLKTRLDSIETTLAEINVNAKDIPYIRRDIVDIFLQLESLNRSTNRLEDKISIISSDLNNLIDFFRDPAGFETTVERIFKPIIDEAIRNGNTEIIDAIARVKISNRKLRNRLEFLIGREKKHYEKLRAAIKAARLEGRQNKEEILDRAWELYSQGKMNAAKLDAIISSLGDVAKTSDLDALHAKLDALDAKIDAIPAGAPGPAGTPGTPGAPGSPGSPGAVAPDASPDGATPDAPDASPDGGASKPDAETPAKPKTPEELAKEADEKAKKEAEKKKKEREERRTKIANGGLKLGIIALILGLIYFLGQTVYRVSQMPQNSVSAPIQIAPVIGQAAKATPITSSILSSIGGINPIVIILVLVALFLLFPKK